MSFFFFRCMKPVVGEALPSDGSETNRSFWLRSDRQARKGKGEKVKLNGQCETRTTEGKVEWTEQRTEDCAATGNPMPRGGERGRRRASQKQPTDGAASQRLRGGRLPLRPIQTSLIKLSNVRAD